MIKKILSGLIFLGLFIGVTAIYTPSSFANSDCLPYPSSYSRIISDSTLTDCQGIDFSDYIFENVMFQGNFSHSIFNRAIFKTLYAQDVNFTDAHFNHSQFSNSDLSAANFTGATLQSTSLERTYVGDANFQNATFDRVYFGGFHEYSQLPKNLPVGWKFSNDGFLLNGRKSVQNPTQVVRFGCEFIHLDGTEDCLSGSYVPYSYILIGAQPYPAACLENTLNFFSDECGPSEFALDSDFVKVDAKVGNKWQNVGISKLSYTMSSDRWYSWKAIPIGKPNVITLPVFSAISEEPVPALAASLPEHATEISVTYYYCATSNPKHLSKCTPNGYIKGTMPIKQVKTKYIQKVVHFDKTVTAGDAVVLDFKSFATFKTYDGGVGYTNRDFTNPNYLTIKAKKSNRKFGLSYVWGDDLTVSGHPLTIDDAAFQISVPTTNKDVGKFPISLMFRGKKVAVVNANVKAVAPAYIHVSWTVTSRSVYATSIGLYDNHGLYDDHYNARCISRAPISLQWKPFGSRAWRTLSTTYSGCSRSMFALDSKSGLYRLKFGNHIYSTIETVY